MPFNESLHTVDKSHPASSCHNFIVQLSIANKVERSWSCKSLVKGSGEPSTAYKRPEVYADGEALGDLTTSFAFV